MRPDQPRVLIVNDDGIGAPGIALLEEIMRQITDDIWVVAPDDDRSGAGHSTTLSYPIRVRQIDDRHFAVKGSPTDCALLGVHDILDRKPDILLSGINRGPNLADDLTRSGTACAAIEGASMGIPAVALSLVWKRNEPVHWDTARRYAPQVLRKLLAMDWQRGTFVNVNFPHCPVQDVTGIAATRLGLRPPGSFQPVRRVDERGVPYYWLRINFGPGGEVAGSDLAAVAENKVSVTPVQLDLTAHGLVDHFGDMLADA